MAGNQHVKQRKGGPGKPFVKGDPRINRTKPGPGAPSQEFRAWCPSLFDSEEARKKLAERMWKVDRNGRSDYILTKLMEYAFGKPMQPMEQHAEFDLSKLSREELETLGRLHDRVAVSAATSAGSTRSGGAGGGQTTHSMSQNTDKAIRVAC